MKDNKKKKKNSVQELIGIDTFSKRGLKTRNGEPVFFFYLPYKHIRPFKGKHSDKDMASDDGAVRAAGY